MKTNLIDRADWQRGTLIGVGQQRLSQELRGSVLIRLDHTRSLVADWLAAMQINMNAPRYFVLMGQPF